MKDEPVDVTDIVVDIDVQVNGVDFNAEMANIIAKCKVEIEKKIRLEILKKPSNSTLMEQ